MIIAMWMTTTTSYTSTNSNSIRTETVWSLVVSNLYGLLTVPLF